MLKKIIIGIALAALLCGSENLLAKKGDKPRTAKEQVQEQPSQRMDGRGARRRQMQQEHDKWLAELTKAYKDNDKKKMGELIEKMNQRRGEMRKKMKARREQWQGLREKRQKQRDFWGDSDDRSERKFRGRRRGQGCPCCSYKGMDRGDRGFRKGMGKQGHGFGHGGMSKKGCGMDRRGQGCGRQGMRRHGRHDSKDGDDWHSRRREHRHSDWDW